MAHEHKGKKPYPSKPGHPSKRPPPGERHMDEDEMERMRRKGMAKSKRR